MHIQIKWIKNFTLMLGIATILCIPACDGGGGGGGGSASLSYSGSTSKAIIDASNAMDMAAESAMAGSRGSSFTSFNLQTTSSGHDSSRLFSIYNLSLALRRTLISLDAHSPITTQSNRSVESEEVSIEGDCGGKLTGAIFADDATGEYWGDISFQQYCIGSITLNGDITFSGDIDLDSGEFINMVYDIGYLSCSDGYGTYKMAGTLSMDNQASSPLIKMGMYIQDGNDDYVFWIRDYQITAAEDASGVAMNISGRFYHPDYGYVTLSTQQALITNFSDVLPVSGVLIAIGETGSEGGPTKAKLTFVDSDLFRVEADTNGSGVYDWDSGELLWSDM